MTEVKKPSFSSQSELRKNSVFIVFEQEKILDNWRSSVNYPPVHISAWFNEPAQIAQAIAMAWNGAEPAQTTQEASLSLSWIEKMIQRMTKARKRGDKTA